MNADEVVKVIKTSFQNSKQPLIINGEPGLGKTTVVHQVVKELDCDFVSFNCDLTDLEEFEMHFDSAVKGLGEFYNEPAIMMIENVAPYFFTEGFDQRVPEDWLIVLVGQFTQHYVPISFVNRCFVINMTK